MHMYDSAEKDLEILTDLRDAYRRIEDLNKRVIALEKFQKQVERDAIEQVFRTAQLKLEYGKELSDDEKYVLENKESILNRIE